MGLMPFSALGPMSISPLAWEFLEESLLPFIIDAGAIKEIRWQWMSVKLGLLSISGPGSVIRALPQQSQEQTHV